MFPGKNEMHLCAAVVIEALQYWMDNKVFAVGTAPKVTGVMQRDYTFIVSLTTDEEKPA